MNRNQWDIKMADQLLDENVCFSSTQTNQLHNQQYHCTSDYHPRLSS